MQFHKKCKTRGNRKKKTRKEDIKQLKRKGKKRERIENRNSPIEAETMRKLVTQKIQ